MFKPNSVIMELISGGIGPESSEELEPEPTRTETYKLVKNNNNNNNITLSLLLSFPPSGVIIRQTPTYLPGRVDATKLTEIGISCPGKA